MVGRLHVVLLSTGAALIYMLWIYGWKKAKVTRRHICQNLQVAEVSHAESEGQLKHDKVDGSVIACEQLAVNYEENSSAENGVASNVSLSDDANESLRSDVSSPHTDGSVLATELTSELSLDVDNSKFEHAATADVCHSMNVSVSKNSDNTTHEVEMLKCPTIDSQDNGAVEYMDDANCCNNCIANKNADDDKVNSDSGCSGNIVASEECDTDRRDSIESASDGNSCHSHDTNANHFMKDENHVALIDNAKDVITHSFDFPTEMCGRLIGQRGRHVVVMKEKSGAEILIRPKHYDASWQIVTLEGTLQQVNKALDMIKRRFPVKRFPLIDYDRCLPDIAVLPADVMQLCLPMGVPVEVIVCSVVTPNHVFLQQPTHPTFPSLERQNYHMRMCYSFEHVPHLPRPIDAGVICAAPVFSDWCRAQVVQSYPDTDEYDLKLVDYGGYLHLPGTSLRQIRSDFMSVPFQAIECYMSSVIPLHDDDDFSPTASTELEDLVKGCILHCEVTAVEEDGVPYVMLTKVSGSEATVVNRELVHRGLARWLEM